MFCVHATSSELTRVKRGKEMRTCSEKVNYLYNHVAALGA